MGLFFQAFLTMKQYYYENLESFIFFFLNLQLGLNMNIFMEFKHSGKRKILMILFV